MEEMLQGLRLGFIIRDIIIYLSLISLAVLTLIFVSAVCSFLVPKKKTFFERESVDISTNHKNNECLLSKRVN